MKRGYFGASSRLLVDTRRSLEDTSYRDLRHSVLLQYRRQIPPAPILVGRRITENKGRGTGGGAALGFFLGWIGVIIAASLKNLTTEKQLAETAQVTLQQAAMYRECPHCKEQMRRDASVCPHCRLESPAWSFHDGHWWFRKSSGWMWLDETKNEWVEHRPDALPEPREP